MPNRIQIRRELFELMASYVSSHYDEECHAEYMKILSGIQEKENALKRHMLYTLSKTCQDAETREVARKMYLDETGIHEDFRWDSPPY